MHCSCPLRKCESLRKWLGATFIKGHTLQGSHLLEKVNWLDCYQSADSERYYPATIDGDTTRRKFQFFRATDPSTDAIKAFWAQYFDKYVWEWTVLTVQAAPCQRTPKAPISFRRLSFATITSDYSWEGLNFFEITYDYRWKGWTFTKNTTHFTMGFWQCRKLSTGFYSGDFLKYQFYEKEVSVFQSHGSVHGRN